MDKQHIIDEIKRTAKGGIPLGFRRFASETGIQKRDWEGKYWRSWGDAQIEAGFQPNQFIQPYSEDFVLESLVKLIRELGRFPASVDFKMRSRRDTSFPSDRVFRRIGTQPALRQRVIAFCRQRTGLDDVIAICEATKSARSTSTTELDTALVEFGIVYLIKSGRFYKIGRTNALGRREYELAIQLPEKTATIHSIKTDDPEGIERYWHERFKNRRVNGEWFELSSGDVAAFKRRRFM